MWSLAYPSLPAHCFSVQLAGTGILFFSAYSNASSRHLTGERPWNWSASCFKCLASSSSISSVNILFASATAPQATDLTFPLPFLVWIFRGLTCQYFYPFQLFLRTSFLAWPQRLHSPSLRGVFGPRLSSWCSSLAWWLFYNVYDIKNKTYVM